MFVAGLLHYMTELEKIEKAETKLLPLFSL